jgi:hypothetical protein
LEDLEKELASCPNRGDAWQKYEWTDVKDQFLLKHWKIDKKQKDIASVLGVSSGTCRDRYLYLKSKGK